MAASLESITLWPASKVPFEPFDDHPAKASILAAMREIEANTGIWFAERGNEPNYIKFKTGGNYSYMGMTGGAQPVHVEAGSYACLHELCHVLGLLHEQSRSDSQNHIQTFFKTDKAIELPCYTIPKDKKGKVDPDNENMEIRCDSRNLTKYDRVSVMQYPKNSGLIEGKEPPSMIWREDPSLSLGPYDATKLSKLDIEGIHLLYENNSGWSCQEKINGVSSQDGPALAVYNNKLYAVWNGYHDDGIFYAWFDGNSWSSQCKIADEWFTADAPALAVYNNRLYVVWNDYYYEGIYYAWSDGHSWSGKCKIEGASTADSPAVAIYNNRLYVAWNGYHYDGIYYAWSDGHSWSNQCKINGVSTKDAPALAVYENRLYAAWNGYHDDGIFYAWHDGNSWSYQHKARGFGTTKGPALGVYHDPHDPSKEDLFMTWQGSGDYGIWWAHFDGSEWSGQARTPYGTLTTQGLAGFQNRLYMAWVGSGNDGIFYASFDV